VGKHASASSREEETKRERGKELTSPGKLLGLGREEGKI